MPKGFYGINVLWFGVMCNKMKLIYLDKIALAIFPIFLEVLRGLATKRETSGNFSPLRSVDKSF
jgi:hypothetical protein